MYPLYRTSGKESKCQNSLVFLFVIRIKIINSKVYKLRREKYRKNYILLQSRRFEKYIVVVGFSKEYKLVQKVKR